LSRLSFATSSCDVLAAPSRLNGLQSWHLIDLVIVIKNSTLARLIYAVHSVLGTLIQPRARETMVTVVQ